MLHGVQIFFENEFIEAQRVFASQDQVNPIYALGSGALAFMKGNTELLLLNQPSIRANWPYQQLMFLYSKKQFLACMTFNESDIQNAIKILQQTETLCNAQIQAAPKKTVPLSTSLSKLVSSGWSYFGYKDTSKSKSPAETPPPPPKHMTNGEIRARVVRAESLLLTSLILLLQESIMSYLKAGLNLRKGRQ